jgi:pimeloyl-ACP methyl ester carboxylesterase
MAPQVLEREVRVGDRTVRALCTPGARQALLLHGDGARAEDWRPVLERLDGLLGACAYERVRLDGDADPRGWYELLDEMRRIHGALGFRDGYTLVGHSLGGLYARLYAAERPHDVSALVLVDPAHEDMPDKVQSWMPRPVWEEWMRLRSHPNADGVRETELAERARSMRPSGSPVTVITGMRRPDPNGNDRFLSEAARRVHASILEGVARGRHVPATRSGHDVHLDEPDLVAREIARSVRQSGWDE